MLKLNINYLSLFEYLSKEGPAWVEVIIRPIDKAFYPSENEQITGYYTGRRGPTHLVNSNAFMGAFQSLVNFYKECRDFFKPYKSRSHFYRDLFSFLRGAGNLFAALVSAILIPFVVIHGCLKSVSRLFKNYFKSNHENRASFSKELKFLLKMFFRYGELGLSWLIDSLSKFVYGSLQVLVLTPLLLLKLPLRVAITLCLGVPSFESDAGVRDCIADIERLKRFESTMTLSIGELKFLERDTAYAICYRRLRMKYNKAKRRGRNFDSDLTTVENNIEKVESSLTQLKDQIEQNLRLWELGSYENSEGEAAERQAKEDMIYGIERTAAALKAY